MAMQLARAERHFIADAAFELRFDRARPHGDAAEDRAHALVRALLPAVDEALDAASAELGDLVVDRIEVDIGAVPAAGVTETERRRLRDSLLAALRRAAGDARTATAAAPPPERSKDAAPAFDPTPTPEAAWRALRAGAVTVADTVAGHDDAELLELVTHVARMALGGRSTADAIRTRAHRLAWPRAFLSAVLADLVAGRDPAPRLDAPSTDAAELWRELRAGTVRLDELTAMRDVPALFDLVEAFARSAAGGEAIELREAVRARLAAAPDPRAFLQAVLADLVAGRDVARLLAVPPADTGTHWRELRAGTVRLDELTAVRDVPALFDLVEAFAQSAAGGEAIELREAVRARLAAASDPRAFLQAVLADLVAGRTLDLDAAVAGAGRPPLDTSPATLARLATALRERRPEVADWIAGRTVAELEALARALAAALDRPRPALRAPTAPELFRALQELAGADATVDPSLDTTPAFSTLTPRSAAALLARLRADPALLAGLVAGRDRDELRRLLEALMANDPDPTAPRVDDVDRRLRTASDPEGLLVRLLRAVVERAPFAPPPAAAAPTLADTYAAMTELLAGQVPAGGLPARLAELTPALARRLRRRWQRDATWRSALLAGSTAEDRAALAGELDVDVDAPTPVNGADVLARRPLDPAARAWLRRQARLDPDRLAALLRSAGEREPAIAQLVAALDEPALAAVAAALAPAAAPPALLRLERLLAQTSDAPPRPRVWTALLEGCLDADAVASADDLLAAMLARLDLAAPPTTAEALPTPDDLPSAYATFARLAEGRAPADATARLVAALARAAPALLDRLLAALRDGALPVAILTRGRDLAELETLLDTLLPRLAPGARELREALDARVAAGRATAPDLERLLGDLVAGHVVDLDAPPADPLPPALARFLEADEAKATAETPVLAGVLARYDTATLASAVAGLPSAAVRLVPWLDEADRARLLTALLPERASDLAEAVERLGALADQPVDEPEDEPEGGGREALWVAALEVAARPPAAVLEGFAASALGHLATTLGRERTVVATGLRTMLAREPERTAVTDALRRGLDTVLPQPASGAVHPSRAAWWTDDAGVVLVAVYLPRLFDHLGLLGEAGFLDDAARGRARAALDRLVWGETDTPESPPRNLVSGLLVGETPGAAAAEPVLDEAVAGLVDDLCAAVVANWSAVGNTSVAGLREAFLQRPGTLRHEGEHWHLRVETRAWDMLLDRLPWTYGLVRHRWMAAPLVVTWR